MSCHELKHEHIAKRLVRKRFQIQFYITMSARANEITHMTYSDYVAKQHKRQEKNNGEIFLFKKTGGNQMTILHAASNLPMAPNLHLGITINLCSR